MKTGKQKTVVLIMVMTILASIPFWTGEVQAATEDFAAGSGTASDPYIITTKAHLNNVRNYKSKAYYFRMEADIYFTEKDYIIGGDFYNYGSGWEPIDQFIGSFDGNGHTISGLKINQTATSSTSVGLFGGLYSNQYGDSEVKNLKIVDCDISVSVTCNTFTNPAARAGGIAGYARNSVIKNCYCSGNITATSVSTYNGRTSYAYTGGIVGETGDEITVSGCENTASVSCSGDYTYAGGIVGDFSSDKDQKLYDCHNKGDVNAQAYVGGYAKSGGIAGGAGGTVTDCSNAGTVKPTSVCNNSAGGIIGSLYGDVEACENSGEIACVQGEAGGIVGSVGSTATVKNCKNSGKVLMLLREAKVGGISGSSSGKISLCENFGEVEGDTANDKISNVGGIVGFLSDDGEVSECQNHGYVHGIGGTDAYASAGGIAGYSHGIVTDSSNDGKVSCIKHDSENVYIGGIIGIMNGGQTSQCTNSGEITLEQTESCEYYGYYCYAGGIIGEAFNEGYIVDCINSGLVNVTQNLSTNAAGIVGYTSSTDVYNCQNKGRIVSSNIAAGIVAIAKDSDVVSCHNSGRIEAISEKNGGGSACGIVGEIKTDVIILRCHNEGNIFSEMPGNTMAGGITSIAFEGSVFIIGECYNSGSVTAIANDIAEASGIICILGNNKVTNCLNKGTITAKTKSSVAGYAEVSGLVGKCDDGIIENSYNVGRTVAKYSKGSCDTSAIVYSVGVNATVSNCFYLAGTGKGISVGTDTTIACTEAQLKKQATFSGFDFDTVWTMEGNEEYFYPELQENQMIVKRYITGDADGDGDITDWDGILLNRYLAGWSADIASMDAMDTDGDGEITDWDGVLLDRYLAGWNVNSQIGM